MQQGYWTFVSGFIVLGLFGGYLFSWIGSQVEFVDQPLWCLLGAAYLVERYGASHLQLYSTTNHIVWHIVGGVGGVLFILTALGLFHLAGVYSFPIAMLVRHLGFYTWYSVRLSYNAFGTRFWEFERLVMIPPLATLLLYFLLVAIWWR